MLPTMMVMVGAVLIYKDRPPPNHPIEFEHFLHHETAQPLLGGGGGWTAQGCRSIVRRAIPDCDPSGVVPG